MTSLDDRLLAVREDISLCRLPSPAAAFELVKNAIEASDSLSQDLKQNFMESWLSDVANYRNAELVFEKFDKGKHGDLLFERIAPRPDWIPGQTSAVQNWPTLSQNPKNPDADIWDKKNPSRCAYFLRLEGLESSKVCVFDWTLGRWHNKLTGEDPQEQLSAEFLDACDKYVFHRILCTIALGGTILIISSWCRDRFQSQFQSRGLVTQSAFLVTKDNPSGKNAGKLFFKRSLGSLEFTTSIVALAESDAILSLVHASSLHAFAFLSAPRLVSIQNGKLEMGDKWFWCQLSHLAKLERTTQLVFDSEASISAQGGSTSLFITRLRIYRDKYADELVEAVPTLPSHLHLSLICSADAIVTVHRQESIAKPRKLTNAHGEPMLDESGRVQMGTGWDQGAINAAFTIRKMRDLMDNKGNYLLDSSGIRLRGDGIQQRVIKRMANMQEMRSLRDSTGPRLDENMQPIMGTGFDQKSITSKETLSKPRPLQRAGAAMMDENGEPVRGSGYVQAAYTRVDNMNEKRQLKDHDGNLMFAGGKPLYGTGFEQREMDAKKERKLVDKNNNAILNADGTNKTGSAADQRLEKMGLKGKDRSGILLTKDSEENKRITRAKEKAKKHYEDVLAGIAEPYKLSALIGSDKKVIMYDGKAVRGTAGDKSILSQNKLPSWFDKNAAGPYIRWYPDSTDKADQLFRQNAKAGGSASGSSSASGSTLRGPNSSLEAPETPTKKRKKAGAHPLSPRTVAQAKPVERYESDEEIAGKGKGEAKSKPSSRKRV